jgi:hypothetical protein
VLPLSYILPLLFSLDIPGLAGLSGVATSSGRTFLSGLGA